MKYEYESACADRIESFIKQKNSIGYPYEESARFLMQFDRMCASAFPKATVLTQEIYQAWAVRRNTEGNNAFNNRLAPIRQFAEHLHRIGDSDYTLPANFVKVRPHQIPYIYTEHEICSIWKLADEFKPTCRFNTRHLVFPAILRLIYCCGLRPCEARKLRMCDVDLKHGKLCILESKGHKDRIVMLSDSMLEYCGNYDEKMSLIIPMRKFFFPAASDQLYTKQWLVKSFRDTRIQANIRGNGELPPRLYDLRHTFATHRLYQWMSEGRDVTALLPYLRAYMGHSKISDTYYYIHLVPGLLNTMTGKGYTSFNCLLPEVGSDE